MKNKRSRSEVVWLLLMFLVITLVSMYAPLYIGFELLPDGWPEPTKFWWSAPTFLILLAGGVGGAVIGIAGMLDVIDSAVEK